MRLFRRALIVAHRYLGLAAGVVVAMWFATGIVMMYAGGMPRLARDVRLDRLPEIDFARVRVTPHEAAERAQISGTPNRTVLLSVMDRPAYRFSGRRAATVFADTGELLTPISLAQSRAVASRFMGVPEERLRHVATIASPDQWSLGQDSQMPQHKFRVDADAQEEIYVSPRIGEVTMITTRRSRMLAWMGTIPHWLYFAPLRTNPPLWFRTVVWTATLCCVLAVFGLILAVLQFRRTRPFRLAASIPYAGLLRWHYIAGGIFGLFTLTWAFSGLLSMEPYAWTNAAGIELRRDAFTGGPVDLAQFSAVGSAAWQRNLTGRAIKEVEFVRIQDANYYRIDQARPDKSGGDRGQVLIDADTLERRQEPFSSESLIRRLEAAIPNMPMTEAKMLSAYDAYYYSRGRQAPLPVLRVKLADPAETWLYIDPEMSEVVGSVHRWGRVERWLYKGMHSLDFPFWYNRRPLWDIGMIALSLGGFATTVLGLMAGIKRLFRSTRTTMNRPLLVAILAIGFSTNAFSQTVSLTGRVADPQGAAVNDALVLLTGPAAKQRAVRTRVDGTFSIPDVAAGSYVLRVEAAGFRPATQDIVVTTAAQSIDVVLQVGGITESVVVAAPRLEEELAGEIERSGSRLQEVASVQIDNGGYYDVGQTLQSLVPGLFLAPKAGAFDYVAASLQGSRTNEILWLVDGVRISNRLYNGTTPLDTLPSYTIERVEVLEGTQGLFYGTQAVAGVVNVVTKSFAESTSGRLQGGFDTNHGRHVNAFARDARRGHQFVLYGSSDQADGFQSFAEDDYQPSTTDRRRSYDVLTLGGKYAYDFSSQLRLTGMYQRNDVRLDSLRSARSSPTQVGGHAAAFNDRTEHIVSTKVDFTAREDAQVFFKGYYHQWDSYWSEIRNVLDAPSTREVISDREFWGFKDYGANLLARLGPHRGLEYFAGYDLQNYSGQDDVLLIDRNTETVHALFGQVRTAPDLLNKVTLAAGVRYNAATHAQNGAVWNVSGRYEITGNLFARANVGTAFRYPDAYELFAVDPTCCFGNPNLKPERSTNVNGSVGGRAAIGGTTLNLEAIGFYRRVSDLIADEDDGSGETTITMNRPELVKVRGLSLVASAVLTNELSGSLGYTYTSSQQTNELAGGYSALAGIPSNQLEGSLDFHPAAPVGLTLTVNDVGKMFDTVSGFGSVASGNYTIVDVSGRVFFDARRRHRVTLRLENLFDQRYTTLHQRGYTDVSATPYLIHNLGTPRTLHLAYGYSY